MGIIIKQGIKNSIYTYLGFALGAFNTMILMPAVMLKEQMGLIQSITSYTNIFTAFFTLGMPLALVKFYNEYKAKGQQSALLFYTLIIPLIAFGAFTIFYFVFRSQFLALVTKDDSKLIYEYFDLMIAMTFSSLIFEIFVSVLKNYFITEAPVFLKELLLRILNTVVLVLCYLHVYDYHTLVYLYAAIFTSLGIILAIYSFVKVPFSFNDIKQLSGKRAVINYGAYTLLNVGITYLVFQLDIVMIQKYLGLAPLAIYAIALNISVLVQLPQRSLLPIMHGVIARAFYDNNMQELESVYKKSALVMTIAGGFMISLIILGLSPLLNILLPPDYTEGLMTVIVILCVAKYVDMFFGFNGYIIIQSPFYRFEVWSGIVLLAICIILNILLIKPLGINGAAMATVLGFLIYNLMRVWYVYSKFKIIPFTKETIKSVLIIFIPLILIYQIPFPDDLQSGIIKSIFYVATAGAGIIFFKPSEDIHRFILRIIGSVRK